MKRLLRMVFGVLLLSLLVSESTKAITLVSDVDDTLKVSNVLDPIDAVVRGLSSDAAFSGMGKTLRSLPSDTHFIYLSGRSQFLDWDTWHFLGENHFPNGTLITHGFDDSDDLEAYKVQKLATILQQTKEDLILIGDDTQSDPEAYAEAIKLSKGRIKAAYIHQITGRTLPNGVVPYLTAAELAGYWLEAGLIEMEPFLLILKTVLKQKKFSRVIVPYQVCPTRPQAWFETPELHSLYQPLQKRIESECLKRAKEWETH